MTAVCQDSSEESLLLGVGSRCTIEDNVLAESFPKHWTDLFFYPISSPSCLLCAYPLSNANEICPNKCNMDASSAICRSSFLSYTWGRSRSPAYAFKVKKDFDPGLRESIVSLFSWLAHCSFRDIASSAVVVGAPPRRTYQWGTQDHLDDLPFAMECSNFEVIRDTFAFSGASQDPLVVANQESAARIRSAHVIVVDNLWNTGNTARAIAHKLLQLGATDVSVCIMSRWLEGDTQAIRRVQRHRDRMCPDASLVKRYYRDHLLGG